MQGLTAFVAGEVPEYIPSTCLLPGTGGYLTWISIGRPVRRLLRYTGLQ
jgi:hypothetical protein